MPVVLPINTGPTKREIVELAFSECGQRAEFGIEPEEYQEALKRLNALMANWQGMGIDLMYAFPSAGVGDPDDDSGIPEDAVEGVALNLAFRLAPTMGKTLSAETRAAMSKAFATIKGKYIPVPSIDINPSTLRGSGRRYGWYGRRW